MMSEAYNPPPAFYFSVMILGAIGIGSALTGVDNSFEDVSGITAEFETEQVAEGGENRFSYRLPKRAKYSNLVLKRGVVTSSSFLAEWCGETIGSSLTSHIVPQNLLVSLLNPNGLPTIVWAFTNAWPVKWEISNMNSLENKILTESLEFSYNYFERVNINALGGAVKLGKLISKI